MTTEKQIAANQANADKSTGPRTEDGKAASKRNALTHGLTARELLLDGEDKEAFDELLDAFIEEQQPKGHFERELIWRLVHLIWRLRRIPVFEAAIISWTKTRLDREEASDAPEGNVPRGIGSAGSLAAEADSQDKGSRARTLREFAGAIDAVLASNVTSKLDRYESSLARQVKETRADLNALKSARDREAKAAEEKAGRIPNESPDDTFIKMMGTLNDRHR